MTGCLSFVIDDMEEEVLTTLKAEVLKNWEARPTVEYVVDPHCPNDQSRRLDGRKGRPYNSMLKGRDWAVASLIGEALGCSPRAHHWLSGGNKDQPLHYDFLDEVQTERRLLKRSACATLWCAYDTEAYLNVQMDTSTFRCFTTELGQYVLFFHLKHSGGGYIEQSEMEVMAERAFTRRLARACEARDVKLIQEMSC